MTVYNINLGIGWASSGVEYAQAYRSKAFQNRGIDAKFVFMEFISQDNICDLTRNLGFSDDQVIWLYTFFTDQKIAPTTYTLADLKASFHGQLQKIERDKKIVKYHYPDQDVFLTAYLKNEEQDIVHRVEYVSRGNLIRKDFFTYTKSFTEYYTPRDGKAHLYQRRFFNEDCSIAFEEIIDGNSTIYRTKDFIGYSKESLIGHFMQKLQLTASDLVILDRATRTGQAVFRHVKPAKLAVVVHAEHFSENTVSDQSILWNNYYEYQFTNADKVDAFLTATDAQKDLLAQQFETYTTHRPKIVTIPVGSLDHLHYPDGHRQPYSLLTASRLADEKHVDWLVKAVIAARKTLPDLQFDIYGAGGQEARLKEIIETNNAKDYIHLKGHQNLTEVYKTYQLYLTASKSEGFGLTLLEAIGSGLPLIGFNARYGNQTFIQESYNGYVIPKPENDDEEIIVTAFANKIITLFKEASFDQMHAYSYQLAEKYLTSNVEKQWQSFVEEMTHD
ncbi:accessory Sec system glycosylation protein GtfA [Streptococcus acidominimus]|uniref:UDP-N-acetylglucosamine--peptide N-acetylglucosaminyltransferase GtfA subunit n=1 Tax=Streptococcus acidominimus TaxID=1326 RepID=A0A239X8C0_STRAI|nr:accessory Sec system glycosyltransferase GtfA [Streptococcus acidominimus]SNV42288.1 accessory Sec system glycosylation protein GtfA [Streptococcus acidominimus]